MEALQDEGIKKALRERISRERVGIEVEKMFGGQSSALALSSLRVDPTADLGLFCAEPVSFDRQERPPLYPTHRLPLHLLLHRLPPRIFRHHSLTFLARPSTYSPFHRTHPRPDPPRHLLLYSSRDPPGPARGEGEEGAVAAVLGGVCEPVQGVDGQAGENGDLGGGDDCEGGVEGQ